MPKTCRFSVGFVLFILWTTALPVVAQTPAPDFSELEKVALEELRTTRTPGAAIAVISGDRVVFAKGVGTSSVETAAPVTVDMLFRLGSTTKMFTAAALVSLAEQGKIKLDQPIGKVVQGLHPRIAAVTAHQLLTHTSGILDEAPMYGSHDESALGKEVRSWKEDRFFTEPGDIYSYSNPAYWCAGFITEEITGKPYADAMAELLFTPLGMSRTTLRPTMAMTYPLSQGHEGQEARVVRPHANNAASWPAGSIFSSVQDLSRWVIAFLNNGQLEGKQVLPAAVITRLSTPYVNIPGTEAGSYGYGLNIGTYRGTRLLRHGGSRTGYGSLIWMAPEQRFGVIILANRSGASLGKTAEKAMEMWIPLPSKPPDSNPSELPIADADKAAWVGTYQNQPAQKMEILLKDGALFLRRGNTELPIRKTGDMQISVSQPGAPQPQQLTLARGKNGKNLYLHSGGRSFRKQ